MLKLTLSIDNLQHDRLIILDKGHSYCTIDGWAVVFFDAKGNYYTPLDLFPDQPQAEAFIAQGLKDGIHIS